MNRLHPQAFHATFALVLVGGLELQVQDASSHARCVSEPCRDQIISNTFVKVIETRRF